MTRAWLRALPTVRCFRLPLRLTGSRRSTIHMVPPETRPPTKPLSDGLVANSSGRRRLIRRPFLEFVWQARLFLIAVCGLSGSAAYIVDSERLRAPELVVEMRSDTTNTAQVFYDLGLGMSEADSAHTQVSASTTYSALHFPLPNRRLRALRFDPIAGAGTFSIRRAYVTDPFGDVVRQFQAKDLVALNQIASRADSNSEVRFSTVPGANDPMLQIVLPEPLSPSPWTFTRVVHMLTGLALALSLTALAGAAYFLILNRQIRPFVQGLVRHEVIIFAAFLLFSGLLSVHLGQDIDWDLRNYHFYNAYAFLNHRLDIDIAPGQLQTYLNPVMDIPAYFLITSLPPIVTGFIWGAMHGINLILVFKISQYIIRTFAFPQVATFGLAFLIAMLSFCGAANMGQLGGFMGDSTIAISELLAIWFFLRDVDSAQPSRLRNVLLSGLCVGLGTGMKLTAAPFVVGLAICFVIWKRPWSVKIRSIIWFGAMAFLGLMLTSAYWMLILARKFQNPIFPFYNSIFRSTYIQPVSFSTPWVMPQSLLEFMVWPVSYLRPNPLAGALRDGRLSLVFVAVIAFVVIKGYQAVFKPHTNDTSPRLASGTQTSPWRSPTGALVAVYFVTYIVWEIEFSIYRYLGALSSCPSSSRSPCFGC